MTEHKPKFYRINFEKLKGESIDTILYFFGVLGFNEDYEYFDKIKHILDIPEEPKTLKEFEYELDKKFEKLLVKTKRKFDLSQQSAEYRYNQKFDRIIRDFKYACKNGKFLPKFGILTGTLDASYITSSGSNIVSCNNVLNLNLSEDSVGYYCIEPVRIHMTTKPNMIFRFFIHKLLGFKWVNGK